MAKYERRFQGTFNEVLARIDSGILSGSMSASLEDGSNYDADNVRCAVRVYERYSFMGGNRLSLNVTLIGNGNQLYLSAITSGGSQAVFFKMNTLGEKAFLDCIIEIVEKYR